jgi:hypothetical protein
MLISSVFFSLPICTEFCFIFIDMMLLAGNVAPKLNGICDKTGNTLIGMGDIVVRLHEYCGGIHSKDDRK